MRLKPKKIIINNENPYENDLLNREEYIKNLINLLELSDDSLVLALTGKYGIGKTTLLKMLEISSQVSGFKTIYFNAWESDFIDDPFSTILAEITNLFPRTSEAKEKIKNAGLNIIKLGIPAIIKALTMNLVDLSEVTEEAISTITSQFASSELEKHLTFKKNIETFKTELTKATTNWKREGKQVLIIVDELDRCKPTYAIKLLESVKHIFDIENIHFIIGLDFFQLSQSVSHVYGQNTDTNGYLRRFFDLQIELSEPNIDEYINFLFEVYELNGILEKRKKYPGNERDKAEFSIILTKISKEYNASLRDIEKCFNIFSYVLSSTEISYFIFPSVLAFLIMLYLFDKTLYCKIINYEITIRELLSLVIDEKKYSSLFDDQYDLNGVYLFGELAVTIVKPNSEENAYSYFDTVIEESTESEGYIELIKKIKLAAQDFRTGRHFDDVMTYIDNKIKFIDTIVGLVKEE